MFTRNHLALLFSAIAMASLSAAGCGEQQDTSLRSSDGEVETADRKGIDTQGQEMSGLNIGSTPPAGANSPLVSYITQVQVIGCGGGFSGFEGQAGGVVKAANLDGSRVLDQTLEAGQLNGSGLANLGVFLSPYPGIYSASATAAGLVKANQNDLKKSTFYAGGFKDGQIDFFTSAPIIIPAKASLVMKTFMLTGTVNVSVTFPKRYASKSAAVRVDEGGSASGNCHTEDLGQAVEAKFTCTIDVAFDNEQNTALVGLIATGRRYAVTGVDTKFPVYFHEVLMGGKNIALDGCKDDNVEVGTIDVDEVVDFYTNAEQNF